jgi:hypothetical protein
MRNRFLQVLHSIKNSRIIYSNSYNNYSLNYYCGERVVKICVPSVQKFFRGEFTGAIVPGGLSTF